MKKLFVFILLGSFILLVLDQSGVLNSLLVFLLVGAIPGTSYNVPSGFMLLAMITIIWLVIFKIASSETVLKLTTKPPKKRLPRRRYNQI